MSPTDREDKRSFPVREIDLTRMDGTLRGLESGQRDMTSKISDLRVLMAEGYVKKVDLETAKADLRREWNDDIVEMRKIVADRAEDDREATKVLRESVNGLRSMLWGVLAGLLLTFGAMITMLIVIIVNGPHR